MESVSYRDKYGYCVTKYPYLDDPVPTMDCFCKPEGCEQWDRANDRLADATILILLLMLAGAVIYGALGGAL